MRISLAVDIHAPPARVFDFLERPERARAWQTSVTRTELLAETPGRVGTTFREVVSEGGRGTELRGRITEFRPGERIAFALDGELNSVAVRFRLEPRGQVTRVVEEAEVRFKSLLRLLSPLLKRKIAAQARAELARLKVLCEAEPGRVTAGRAPP